MKTYYETLGVETSASEDEIRSSYKFLIKAFHPDRFSDPQSKAKAEKEIKEINEAYSVLSNIIKRKDYNEKMGLGKIKENRNKNAGDNSFSNDSDNEIQEYILSIFNKWETNIGLRVNDNRIIQLEKEFSSELSPLYAVLGSSAVSEELVKPLLWLILTNICLGAEIAYQGLPNAYTISDLEICSSKPLISTLSSLFSSAEKISSKFRNEQKNIQIKVLKKIQKICSVSQTIGKEITNQKNNETKFSNPYSNYSTTPPNNQKHKPGCFWWIIGITVFIIILLAIKEFITLNNFDKAQKAYEKADCENAIIYYDKIINSWNIIDSGNYVSRSESYRTECQAFQNGIEMQFAGDSSGSIVSFIDFIVNYNQSSLSDEARNHIKIQFEQSEITDLISAKLCDQVITLDQKNLIPDKNSTLPNLYYGCGKEFERISLITKAINMYESFLLNYPNHSNSKDVENALARVLVAEAKGSGAGVIPLPEMSGKTESGSTIVIIQNDSPERMQIVFSGPESRIEKLDACSSCIKYYGNGPTYCPEKGPVGRYTLTPGNYEVLVESISDKGITPWVGDWVLQSGNEYSNCFFIVTSSSP